MSTLVKIHMRNFSSRTTNQGVSLVEVLIAVLILGIGMLGIAAMQATALSNSQSSVERTQAVLHTYTIFDTMRANRDAALANAYTGGGIDSGLLCDPAAIAGVGLAANDMRRWITNIIASNQTGCGRIQNNGGVFTVTVQWNDQRGTGDGVIVGSATQQLVTVSRL